MATISKLLADLNGIYIWGERDCFTTSRAIIEFISGSKTDIKLPAWAAITDEKKARATARKRKGGIKQVYESVARQGRLKVVSDHKNLYAGDIVLLSGKIRVHGGLWDTATEGELLGFADDALVILVWAAHGLVPAKNYQIEKVYRCQRR